MSESAPATPLYDALLGDTGLRGLVLQGPMTLCAYLGVPRDHWAANMDELDFDCHGGITFRAEGGGENDSWPADWFWYGWDYGHWRDGWNQTPAQLGWPKSAWPMYAQIAPPGKVWTVDEVVVELIDAAVELSATLKAVQAQAAGAGQRARQE